MSLDLSKLSDAITAVAGIATARDAAVKALADAQSDVDALTASLLSAVSSPAEAVGIAAVSAALAPVVAPAVQVSVSPAPAPVAPAAAPVATVAQSQLDHVTFLPGDPRNPATHA